jgi:hypothetical protein
VIARLSPDLNWEDALGAPGVVHARRRRRVPCPRRGAPPLPHLHLLELLHGAHARDHARGPGPLRRRRALHERLAAAGRAAGLLLRRVPQAGQAEVRRTTGTSSPSGSWNSGSSTTGSRRRRSRTASSSPTWAAGVRPRPTWALAEVCQWYNCDNQGRGGDGLRPIWGARSRAGSRRRHEGPHGHERDRGLVDHAAPSAGATWPSPGPRRRSGWTRRWRAA